MDFFFCKFRDDRKFAVCGGKIACFRIGSVQNGLRQLFEIVVLSCESMQYMKGALAKALQSLGFRGVECCIIIRKPSSRDEDFIRAGIKLIQADKRTIRAAIIDRSLLWFGSIDLAGSHHREEDNVMRVLAPLIASEMLGYVLVDNP